MPAREEASVELMHPEFERFVRALRTRDDDPVLLEMEAEARSRDFPIVDRVVGVTLELLARAISARRVFELGSGFGYSAYWFSRAIGPDGELHLTDRDEGNRRTALDYLERAGLADPVRFHVGDALDALEGTEGEFDVVFTDIDKGQYPEAWARARGRVRLGGLYLCDNAIQAGGVNVVTMEDTGHRGWADAILEHDTAVASDPDFVTTILPLRDGLLVALRVG
jgi:caffeoyl-CoA O-methyltransferase